MSAANGFAEGKTTEVTGKEPDATNESENAEGIFTEGTGIPANYESLPISTESDKENDIDNVQKDSEDAAPAFGKTIMAIKGIDSLDVDAALLAMGGVEEVYEKSIKLFARLLPDSIQQLNEYLTSDIKAFAIKVHGTKGTLHNIGAFTLGEQAEKLEMAAKSGDLDYCNQHFNAFISRLEQFSKELNSVFARTHGEQQTQFLRLRPAEEALSGENAKGDVMILAEALVKVREACDECDALLAQEIMEPFSALTFDEPTNMLIQEITQMLEVFDCEKALESITKLSDAEGWSI